MTGGDDWRKVPDDEELTTDRIRMLLLISRFSSPSTGKDERERWFKEMPLMTLITRGIWQGVFKKYDVSPTLIEYMGIMRFATVSKEGEDDVSDLCRLGMVDKLKLATKHHYYVSAFRVTDKGLTAIKDVPFDHHKAVNKLIHCEECEGRVVVITRKDSPYLFCRKCGKETRVPIFDIEEVPYVTSPVFTSIWLPPR
jgi:hypothetical protein